MIGGKRVRNQSHLALGQRDRNALGLRGRIARADRNLRAGRVKEREAVEANVAHVAVRAEQHEAQRVAARKQRGKIAASGNRVQHEMRKTQRRGPQQTEI